MLSDLLNILDTWGIERLEHGDYRMIGTMPDWVSTFFPNAAEENKECRPENICPFLENFLTDAQVFWAEEKEGRIKSGIWISTDAWGNECAFEGLRRFFLKTENCCSSKKPAIPTKKDSILIQKGQRNRTGIYIA